MRTSILSAALAALVSLPAPPVLGATPADGEPQPRVPLPFFQHGPGGSDPETFPGFPGLKSPFAPGRPAPAGSPTARPDDEAPAGGDRAKRRPSRRRSLRPAPKRSTG